MIEWVLVQKACNLFVLLVTLEKLKRRLNRHLQKLAKWSDSPADERLQTIRPPRTFLAKQNHFFATARYPVGATSPRPLLPTNFGQYNSQHNSARPNQMATSGSSSSSNNNNISNQPAPGERMSSRIAGVAASVTTGTTNTSSAYESSSSVAIPVAVATTEACNQDNNNAKDLGAADEALESGATACENLNDTEDEDQYLLCEEGKVETAGNYMDVVDVDGDHEAETKEEEASKLQQEGGEEEEEVEAMEAGLEAIDGQNDEGV